MYDVGITMTNAMHVLAEQKVNKGVNIAFSVTMEMQKFGPSPFWKELSLLLFGLTSCCEYSYQKVSRPCAAIIMLLQLAFLTYFCRWDIADA